MVMAGRPMHVREEGWELSSAEKRRPNRDETQAPTSQFIHPRRAPKKGAHRPCRPAGSPRTLGSLAERVSLSCAGTHE